MCPQGEEAVKAKVLKKVKAGRKISKSKNTASSKTMGGSRSPPDPNTAQQKRRTSGLVFVHVHGEIGPLREKNEDLQSQKWCLELYKERLYRQLDKGPRLCLGVLKEKTAIFHQYIIWDKRDYRPPQVEVQQNVDVLLHRAA
jgi:hypothetical protein